MEYLEMHSLYFEEFCMANGIRKNTLEELKYYFDNKKSVPKVLHEKMMELFRLYIVIGGTPKVVSTYIETKDFNLVMKIQKEIIGSYKMDISKYAKDNERAKIHACFTSIPKQLANLYKKFRFNVVEKMVVQLNFKKVLNG